MRKIIVAIGLRNDNELTDMHFGDSVYFDIYELTNNSINELKKIKNAKIEERMHGDSKKANAIGNLLKGSDVLVAFRMGPNILRMKKKFVPVIVNTKNIEKVKETLIENYYEILTEISREGEKNYITLKVKEA